MEVDQPNGYIYVIRNTIDGKQYVGLTRRTVEARWKQHHQDANSTRRKHLPLYCAMRKYGVDSFSVETLEEVPIADLCAAERAWVAKLNTLCPNGYNMTTGGEVNKDVSSQTRERLAMSHKGQKPWNKGKTLSPEYRAKLSASHVGLRAGEDHPRWGKTHSIEARRKISETQLGKKLSDEHKARIAATCKANSGRWVETLRESGIRAWSDPVKRAERIAKCRATRERNRQLKDGPVGADSL